MNLFIWSERPGNLSPRLFAISSQTIGRIPLPWPWWPLSLPHAVQIGAPSVPHEPSSPACPTGAATRCTQLRMHLLVILFWSKQSQRQSVPSGFDRMDGPLLSQAPKSGRVHRGMAVHQFKRYKDGKPTWITCPITKHAASAPQIVPSSPLGQGWP